MYISMPKLASARLVRLIARSSRFGSRAGRSVTVAMCSVTGILRRTFERAHFLVWSLRRSGT